MKDAYLNKFTFNDFILELQKELEINPDLLVSTQNAKIGKWGMSQVWRIWMAATADYMAKQGAIMPTFLKPDGTYEETRPFNKDDAHELFTVRYLGTGDDGMRLSWAKAPHDGMRTATKGERFIAMLKHEHWCTERGILLLNPRDGEYQRLFDEQNK